jgi:hypothetical protein
MKECFVWGGFVLRVMEKGVVWKTGFWVFRRRFLFGFFKNGLDGGFSWAKPTLRLDCGWNVWFDLNAWRKVV